MCSCVEAHAWEQYLRENWIRSLKISSSSLLGCNIVVVFIRTQMGSSLYELDLELFEDIDSEVGNYLMVDAPTDIFISTVLALLRGFSSEVSGFLPDTKTNTSKFQLELKTVDKEPLCGMCHCKFLSILF